ncbi:MAG: GyrI-like domain-containing protein [Kiloniellales bacterium]|nr:GyrI-like domain-containing protein [Kiloniellales bacterium]
MKLHLEEWESFSLIGPACDFTPADTSDIPGLWKRLGERLSEIGGHPANNRYFGYCIAKGGNNGEQRYLAGVECDRDTSVPEGLEKINVPARLYAVFTHKIENPNLGKDLKRTFSAIFSEWLPQTAYQFIGSGDFELYDERFDPKTMSGTLDIYIPVEPRE